MGWSAGGHLVNKLITFTSRFKAAGVRRRGRRLDFALRHVRHPLRSRYLVRRLDMAGKMRPFELYWEHSPLKYISAARTPTLFLIGENDPRVPAAQSIEIMRALKAQGVPSELHIAPG
jgi:dipeptidyl aminopeptidase/acylaminoacyl peptidase